MAKKNPRKRQRKKAKKYEAFLFYAEENETAPIGTFSTLPRARAAVDKWVAQSAGWTPWGGVYNGEELVYEKKWAQDNPDYAGSWTTTPTPWTKPKPRPAPKAPRAKPASRTRAVEGLPVEYVDAADGRIYGVHLSRGGTPVLWETREMRSDVTYTSGEEPESMKAWYAALRSLPQKKAKKRAKKKAKKRARKNPSRADILRRAMRGT